MGSRPPPQWGTLSLRNSGSSLSYADDLAIAASSSEDIKKMSARMEEFTRWAKLRFNVAKCATLSTLESGPPAGI